MEKLPKAYEKEYMRIAMLKHEETFKQQVHELHRLYRTQKTMMKNVVEKGRQQSGWSNPESWDKIRNNDEICFRQIYEQDANNYYRTSSTHTTKLDLEQPAEEDETEANNNGADLQIINENELLLTLGPSSYNNTSDSGITHSSSSTGSSHEDAKQVITGQEMEVLGLSTGNSSGYKNGSNRGGEKKKMLDYPPWPFQTVSLKHDLIFKV